MGVATAAGAEALPILPGACTLLIGVVFTEDFMKRLEAKITLYLVFSFYPDAIIR